MDLALSAAEEVVRREVGDLLDATCPTTRVRAAEPLGFDAELWSKLESAPVPYAGRLTELAVASEEVGKRLAPVPVVEVAVTRRLLTASNAPVPSSALPTLALRPVVGDVATLVPAGAVATEVVALIGDRLVVAHQAAAASPPPNLGSLPVANVHVGAAHVLAEGVQARAAFDHAVDEWRTLTAAALVGLAQGAFDRTVQRVRDREQFGVPIGSFQVVQHRLADLATQLDGARLLTWHAAWEGAEQGPRAAELAAMALLFAAETAVTAATEGLHLHGGLGFTLDCDIQLYFRRAKAWSLLLADPERELLRLGDVLYGGR